MYSHFLCHSLCPSLLGKHDFILLSNNSVESAIFYSRAHSITSLLYAQIFKCSHTTTIPFIQMPALINVVCWSIRFVCNTNRIYSRKKEQTSFTHFYPTHILYQMVINFGRRKKKQKRERKKLLLYEKTKWNER